MTIPGDPPPGGTPLPRWAFLRETITSSDASVRIRFRLGRLFRTFEDVWRAPEHHVTCIKSFGATSLSELRGMFMQNGFRFRSNNPARWDPVIQTEAIQPGPDRVVWRDAPEFLPVTESTFARVSEVDVVTVFHERIECFLKSGAICYAAAPYFAAWLERLGIPWTEELRKAHAAAGKGEA